MKIFVSASNTDSRLITELTESLRALWHDVQTSDAPTWEQAFQSIRDCDVLILAVSPESLESVRCNLECEYACALNKRILPLLLCDIDLPADLTFIAPVRYQQAEDIEQVREALWNLPKPLPRLIKTPLYPNVFLALNALREEAVHPMPDALTQIRLMHNLQAFMHRRETFAPAQAILQLLRKDTDAAEPVKREIKAGVESMMTLRLAALKRQLVMTGSGVCAAVVAVFLLGNALVMPTEAVETFMPVDVTVTVETVGVITGQTYFIAPTQLVTEESEAATAIPSPTYTLTATFTSSPTFTITPSATSTLTPTLPPTATSTFTATFTITPSPTLTITPSPQPSATQTPLPTLTFTPHATLLPLVYNGIATQDSDQGVLVVGISEEVAAAGVQIGDEIIGVDMQLVSSAGDFYAALSAYQPFSNVMLRLRRGTEELYLQVSLAAADFEAQSDG